MKPASHKKITELAFGLCQKELSPELRHPGCQQDVIQGTADEDTKNLWQRATNWHFYRAEDSPVPVRVRYIFKPTSEDIVRQRIAEFMAASKGARKRANLLGRILHHIQDMCTPSHVVPIYHGPKLPLFLSGRIIPDHFENFLDSRLPEITVDDAIIGEFTTANVCSFADLYQAAARDMLTLLEDVRDGVQLHKLFWQNFREQEAEKIAGFGNYGPCHDYFMEGGLETDNPHGITSATLLAIERMITDQAIQHTCRGLLFAAQNGYM